MNRERIEKLIEDMESGDYRPVSGTLTDGECFCAQGLCLATNGWKVSMIGAFAALRSPHNNRPLTAIADREVADILDIPEHQAATLRVTHDSSGGQSFSAAAAYLRARLGES